MRCRLVRPLTCEGIFFGKFEDLEKPSRRRNLRPKNTAEATRGFERFSDREAIPGISRFGGNYKLWD